MLDGNFWSLLGILAVVVLILYLAYVSTKWIGTHGAPGGMGTSAETAAPSGFASSPNWAWGGTSGWCWCVWTSGAICSA